MLCLTFVKGQRRENHYFDIFEFIFALEKTENIIEYYVREQIHEHVHSLYRMRTLYSIHLHKNVQEHIQTAKIKSSHFSFSSSLLKGQCHEIFWHFFIS